MLRRLLDVRPDERRSTAIAFLALFGILAAHTILETARDALFLARLPPSQLPWMYLAIAAVAIELSRWSGRRLGGPRALASLLLAGAGGTFAFWTISGSPGPWMLRALYVWTGLVSTLGAVQFWLVVGEIYTITQAKRVYAVIGLGSLLGAVAGGAAARLVSSRVDAQQLLLVSAAVLAATAIGPAMLLRAPGARSIASDTAERTFGDSLRLIRGNPCLTRLTGLVLVSTLAVTIADYVFKSAVSRTIAPRELAPFFASFYTALNALALGTQLVAVSWLLRRLGVSRVLGVLPVILLVSASGVAVGGGMLAVLLMKGADGVLRPSLHRVGLELLYVPIPDRLRSIAKPLTDVLAQRGGQALASVCILVWLAWGGGDAMLAIAATVLCAAWIASTIDLQPHYLELFREGLRSGTLTDTAHLPELDIGALEALFSALNSQSDAEVLGALDLLADEGRGRLVPTLLLYHPSRVVVLRTFNLLAKSGRLDFLPIADRLLESGDAEIRAAALRARSTVQPDEAVLTRAAGDASPLVRATALVGLVAGGWGSDGMRETIDELAESGSAETALALARAIERQPSPGFDAIVLRLSESPDARVLRHVAHAMAAIRSEAFVPRLLQMLGRREVRNETRAALLEYGDAALQRLDAALDDGTLSPRIRRHIPRTISLFPPDRVVTVLQRQLIEEQDGLVRFKILRGLGRIAADHPEARFDEGILRQATDHTIDTATQLLYWRINAVRGAADVRARGTPGHSLIVLLLRDKERHAIERLFRLLGLKFRHEDLRSIHRGLGNANPKVRASSRELLENLLAPPLRRAVLGLVDDGGDERRLASLQPALAGAPVAYDALLGLMSASHHETLRALVEYHARELGLRIAVRPEAHETNRGSTFAAGVHEAAQAMAAGA